MHDENNQIPVSADDTITNKYVTVTFPGAQINHEGYTVTADDGYVRFGDLYAVLTIMYADFREEMFCTCFSLNNAGWYYDPNVDVYHYNACEDEVMMHRIQAAV